MPWFPLMVWAKLNSSYYTFSGTGQIIATVVCSATRLCKSVAPTLSSMTWMFTDYLRCWCTLCLILILPVIWRSFPFYIKLYVYDQGQTEFIVGTSIVGVWATVFKVWVYWNEGFRSVYIYLLKTCFVMKLVEMMNVGAYFLWASCLLLWHTNISKYLFTEDFKMGLDFCWHFIQAQIDCHCIK